MCDFCEHDKNMMTRKVMDRANWGWGYDGAISLTLIEAEDDPNTLGVFIDRGHLRMVEMHDADCLDGGEKIKIKFCPMCGKEIT